MRPEGQIRQQLKQVTFRHLQKRLRENFRQRPDNCAFNQGSLIEGQTRNACGFIEAEGLPRLIVCDSRSPGCAEMARKCPLWQPRHTKEDIKQDFLHLIQGDRGLLAAQYPDIAALMWVLDSAGEPLSASEIQEAAEPPPDSLGHPQFFKPDQPAPPEPAVLTGPTLWDRFWHRGGPRK